MLEIRKINPNKRCCLGDKIEEVSVTENGSFVENKPAGKQVVVVFDRRADEVDIGWRLWPLIVPFGG